MKFKGRGLLATFAVALVVLVGLAGTPQPALAEGNAARVGDAEYATFDEAVAAAPAGATVTLLEDATTSGLNLSRDLTVDGGSTKHSLTFGEKGIALWGHALTFKNVDVSMAGVGSTPYVEWSWMSVCASRDASLTLDGATLTMDGAGAGDAHAIYFCSNNKLNVQNGSVLAIKNYAQDALEWDGGDGGYNVNVTGGSKYVSDHNRSGFTGTFYATIDASTVQVINSTGNGSNGSHYAIKNGSYVEFTNNGVHGLSAGNLSVCDSTVKADCNGYNGIIFTGKGEFKNADVEVSATKGKNYWNAGVRLLKANATLDVDAASKVSITGNQVTGLFLDAGSRATFANGAQLVITDNDASQANCSTKKDLAQCGGGVVVRSGASLELPSASQINNNHALLAGDDVYVEQGGKLALSAANVGVELDAFDGCNDAIDAWYDDGAGARWNAHDAEALHVEAVDAGAFTDEVALKAAHGLGNLTYAYVGEAPDAAELPDAQANLVFGTYDVAAQTEVNGWTFDGWYLDEACTVAAGARVEVMGDVTLYGKWTKNVEPAPTPKPEEPTKPADSAKPSKPAKKVVPATGDATSGAFVLLAVAGVAVAAAGTAVKRRK